MAKSGNGPIFLTEGSDIHQKMVKGPKMELFPPYVWLPSHENGFTLQTGLGSRTEKKTAMSESSLSHGLSVNATGHEFASYLTSQNPAL